MRKFHIIAVLIDWYTAVENIANGNIYNSIGVVDELQKTIINCHRATVEVFYDSNIQQFNCFFLRDGAAGDSIWKDDSLRFLGINHMKILLCDYFTSFVSNYRNGAFAGRKFKYKGSDNS